MSLLYSLIARDTDTILCSYSPHKGNFENIAVDAVKRLPNTKKYGMFAMARYDFYIYNDEGYVFLAMTETGVGFSSNLVREKNRSRFSEEHSIGIFLGLPQIKEGLGSPFLFK